MNEVVVKHIDTTDMLWYQTHYQMPFNTIYEDQPVVEVEEKHPWWY
jgi:hypothetical protein